jgi:hypothetical protein
MAYHFKKPNSSNKEAINDTTGIWSEINKKLTAHDFFEVFVLLDGLEADEVHAALATVVPGVEPVPVCICQLELRSQFIKQKRFYKASSFYM